MVTNLSCRRCLIGPQKGVSKTSKGHVLQANWASFQTQMTIDYKLKYIAIFSQHTKTITSYKGAKLYIIYKNNKLLASKITLYIKI